ncbi:MAG TPA: heme o synthase [Micropepsaceae bacterium]|nr:heme o synthase [Micropepsaceae bacterium]
MTTAIEDRHSVALAESEFATVADYFALLKPRVMSLVLFTAVAGLVLAPGHVPLATALTALLCIAVGAGASGALNMAYDGDIDALMSRTIGRPVPQGRITAGSATGFGIVMSIGAVTTMGLLVNPVAAALLAFTIAFYVLIYTAWLKRRTPQNIVIGGLAGALPPAIGWASVTGSLAIPPLVLVAIIFLWTPAHFWALSLYRTSDYVRARVPMLPVISGKRETRRQIVLYAVLTVIAGFAPLALGFAGPVFGAVNGLLGGWFVVQSLMVAVERDETREPQARRLFGISILYLFAVFAAVLLEQAAGIAPLTPLIGR